MKKTLSAIATTVFLGATSWLVFQTGFAAPVQHPIPAAKERWIRIIELRPTHSPQWHLGFRHNKELSSQDAKTITKAALLMRGKHNLNVGPIEAKQTRFGKLYLIDIVNKQKKVVNRIILNSRNGEIRPFHMVRARHR